AGTDEGTNVPALPRRATISTGPSAPAPARDLRAVRRHFAIGLFSVVGVASFNGLSYLKFDTIDGCPLRLNVQYDAARLARIDGKQFHLVNLPVAWETYITQPNFKLDSHFPF